MKFLICVPLLAAVCLVLAEDLYPRGCIYIDGICQEECEIGTHSYTSGCGYLTPEPTCDNPNPQPVLNGQVCDFSACYCDYPTVRDRKTNKCVPLNKCKKSRCK